MQKYVAFLRAVNVGGHKAVKMRNLKRLFESAGLAKVETFIQSGNVIFEHRANASLALKKKLEAELEKKLGYRVEVFLRTIEEVSAVVNHKLYKPKETETLHVVFLNEAPDKKTQRALMDLNSEADDFKVKDREVYNLRRDRDTSIFSNNLIEKMLGVPATTRNITTIRKIAEKYG